MGADMPSESIEQGGGVQQAVDEPPSSGARRAAREGPSAPPDEAEIQSLLARGEARRAIAGCARVMGPSVGRLCFAMLGDQAEADEALQESLLAAYDAAASFRGEGSVRAWVYGIARRTCARRLEIRARQARRRTLLRAGDGPEPPVDQRLDEAQRGAAVRRALDALRPTEREAVLLRYESELSFREVASACGIAEEAARQRVSRALAKLREKLST